MDSRVDFALDRARVLAPNLVPPGTLGPITSYGSDITARVGVSDLTRTATPSTITSLAQYQSRFLPSTMSMHSPGASFALMGGFLGGAAPGDNLKSLMPDMQFWASHGDGYPRFVINSNPYTSPFGTFLPAADTMPTLLPPAPAGPPGADVAHCHRIYELQKDAFLASVAASQAGLYGIFPHGHPYMDRPPSPHPQQQPASLNLTLVKQEPRDTSSTCLAAERPSSKAPERRIHGATPRSHESGKDLPKDIHSTNNNSSSSNSNRSQSSHRSSSSSRVQQKTVEKKNPSPAKVPTAEDVLCADRKRETVASRPVEKRQEPLTKTQTRDVHVSSANEVHPKNTNTQTKSGKVKSDDSATHKPSVGQVPKFSSVGQRSTVSKPVLLHTDKTTASAVSRNVVVPSNASSGQVKENKEKTKSREGAHARGQPQKVDVSRKGVESVTATSVSSAGEAGERPRKKKTRDRNNAKHGVHSAAGTMDKGNLSDAAPGGSDDISTQQPTSVPASAAAAAAAAPRPPSASHSKSVVSTAAAAQPKASSGDSNSSSSFSPVPQPVPTLSTITTTPPDANVVTSVPVTSGGTQSVFARSQPVVSVAAAKAASPMQLSSSSVTSQVATSALPYYHTLYSKTEGDGQGTGAVKRVHATTTFVPEVGTFKGPLIRSMSKGCLEPRVKSEHRTACCQEGEAGGKSAGGRSDEGSNDGSDRTSSGHDIGSEDEPSDLSTFSSHRQQHQQHHQRHGADDDPSEVAARQLHVSPPAGEGRPGGLACSSRSSNSVSYHGHGSGTLPLHAAGPAGVANVSDVALDFSISRRTKYFSGDGKSGVRKEQPQAKVSSRTSCSSNRTHASASIHGIPNTATSSATVYAAKVQKPVDHPESMFQSSVPSSSSYVSHLMQDPARQASTVSSLSPARSDVTSGSEAHALNLSRSATNRTQDSDASRASSSRKAPLSGPSGGGGGETAYRVASRVRRIAQLVAGEKRCGSAPPRSSVPDAGGQARAGAEACDLDNYTEEDDAESSESSQVPEDKEEVAEPVASNIPVGIAVAQQRSDASRADTRPGASRAEDSDGSRQLTHDFTDREDYLRQQKAVLTGAAKPIPSTGLPPNLVVTGGENSLNEDIHLRPLANQWLTASHGLAPTAWLPQNPFTIHPAIPTSTAAFDPSHHPVIPSGFKLAHDSLTGQLLIIPSGELVDQNALWSAFQSTASAQPLAPPFTHLPVPISQHASVTAVPPTDSDEHEQHRADGTEEQPSVEESDQGEEEDSNGFQVSENGLRPAFSKDKAAPTSTAATINNNNMLDNRDKGESVNLNTSYVPTPADLAAQSLAFPYQAATGIPGAQFPFVFNPALLPLPPGLPVGEPLSIKTESPSVQSRGTSPIVLSPPPSDDVNKGVKEAFTGPDPKPQVSKVCVSVQTGSDLASDLDPAPKVTSKEQGIQTCQEERLEPLSVICGSSDFAMPSSLAGTHSELFARHRVTAPFGSVAALAAAAMVAEGNLDSMTTSITCGRGHGPGYNPFTDPQILQAADGLELLSTLAEKRPKCSSALVDPKAVFPSPSDSFKSDTPLPCVELDDSASVGEEERSGQTTPRTDRPRERDLSPKWGVVRKEFGASTATTECKFTTTLANMDAMELDMRIRLAELQRQYREKQRELAKLGPKKEKDDGVKRGRGRPRKRKFVNKKYDDDSSNSSGGKTTKDPPVKRKRPAEELVDRVFRKLPPAKVGKLKAIPVKHKRRPSHSTATSSDADTSRDSGKKKDKHRHGNLFANLESTFGDSCLRKKSKKESGIVATATCTTALPSVATTISPVTLESGLNILAKFATSALSSSSFAGIKRKTDESPWDHGSADTHLPTSPGHSPSNKRRESDTDNSDTANGTCVKKRKPGRPRKCDPNKTTGFTETIWARQSGLLQLSDVAQGKSWVSKAEEAATSSTVTTSTATATTGSKLSAAISHGPASQAPLAPLLLDEWSLRRSERIFLSDTSPLPSPNQQAKDGSSAKAPGARDCRSSSAGGGGAGTGGSRGTGRIGRPPGSGSNQRRNSSVSSDKACKRSSSGSTTTAATTTTATTTTTTTATTASSSTAVPAASKVKDASTTSSSTSEASKVKVKDEKRDRDHAKVQKARSLQELTQKVKRKYSKNLCKKPASDEKLQPKKTAKDDVKVKTQPNRNADQESDSSSEGDNLPLSCLRERPTTPEPRSCTIRQEELREGLHVLLFRDSLFYEGVVQAIQPPDIYGVVVTGQRGSRPHIYSREEILKDAIVAVPPGSQRYLTEGTRVCAYWSQQFRCLYPGTVAKTSPNPHAESSVNVEFDDGDSGRIPISHVRLLPPDFPLVTEQDLNPLLFPAKRRRNTTTSEDDFRKGSEGPHHSSDSGLARRDSRPHNADDNNSDDGEVFENLPQKSGAEKGGKATRGAKSQTSGGQDDSKKDEKKKVRKEVGTKDKRPNPIIRPASFNPKKLPAKKKDDDKDYSEEEDSDEDSEDDSDDESDDDYSSSVDRKKTNRSDAAKNNPTKSTPDGKKSNRGRKKKRGDDVPAYVSPRPLWRWAGRSTKRPGMRGKAKKEFYRSIVRGSDHIMVGDSAVFLSTGRDHCPYIGRIESLWAGWGGQMTVKVKWFYHPEETKGGKTLAHSKGALFESPHGDENDVQTISHKCYVLSYREYTRRAAEVTRKGQTLDPNIYYQAGYYDPTIGLMRLEPDVQ